MKQFLITLYLLIAYATLHAETATVNGITWNYRVSNGKAEIYKDGFTSAIPSSMSGAITIPSTLGGNPVTSIGNYAFYGCTGLTSVTIPEGVTSIGDYAFYNCSSLPSVTIPSSVTEIGPAAFSGCNNLPRDENDVQYESLERKVLIEVPMSVTGQFIIPNSVHFILSYAFSGCSSLTSVTIPSSVISIGEEAFNWCNNLTTFVVDSANQSYSVINNLLCSKNGKKLIQCPVGLTSVIIPSSVTEIENRAFDDCRKLTSVTIPANVVSIGEWAFCGCSLTSVVIPEGVIKIGMGAFTSSGLTSVTIPSSVDLIGNYAFDCCYNLKSVVISEGVTSIGDSAFHMCNSLTSVTIPSTVTSIGEWAFDYCNITSITIPEGVTEIEEYAFAECPLTSMTIPSSVTSIGEGAFYRCLSLTAVYFNGEPPRGDYSVFDNDLATGYYLSKYASEWETVIDSNGKWNGLTMEEKAMSDDPSNPTSPDSSVFTYEIVNDEVTITGVQGDYPTEIEIPSTLAGYPVTTIGDSAFQGCVRLRSVIIPNSVISIGERGFWSCSSLTSMTIPSSVVTIGESAFMGCSSLISVTIPSSVASIGVGVFSGCSNLMSMTIPQGVTSIGDLAFSNCDRLVSVTIPESITTIGFSAFSFCTSLTSVTIPSSVTEIGNQAFNVCTSLTSLHFNGEPPSVGDSVFDNDLATGYYLSKYAPEWKTVIDSNGKWNGLTMVEKEISDEPTNPNTPEAYFYPTYRVPLPYPAASFTATPVGMEQVTLKVTATKGYVFAGWHKDEAFTESCDSTLADYRNPTYTYNVDADSLNFNARFVKIDEDIRLDLLETKSITPKGNDQRAIQLVIDSYSLPKVSVKGLPAGMKFAATPVMVKGSKTEVEYPANTIYGTPTKPGIYTVTVSLTNSTIKKAITKTFEINVLNFTDDLIRIADSYGPYTPGVSYTVPISAAEGCTVSGLPAGMKWTAKDIYKKGSKTEIETPANSVYGIPTTPGNCTVYFTKTVDKVKHTATATFKVGPYPQLNVMVSDGGVGGKVTGAGGFAANKKVTLKATPNKGYVFAGWYEDEFFTMPCDSTLVDYRNPSYTYVMGEDDTQFYARFVTKEEEADYEMGIELIDEYYNSLGDDVQVRAGEVMEPGKVWVDSLTLPTAKVTGLPTGLKFDSKTFTISGNPTKPGFYPITIEVKNASKSRSAFAIVNLEVRHFDAHGLHGDWEDAEPIVVDAFTTERFDLEDWFDEFFDGIPIKSLKLPAGLTYNATTGEIKGNGTLKSGSYTVTLTDKAGQVTTFTIVAELDEADMFTYEDYFTPNEAWDCHGVVQGANTDFVWISILKAKEESENWWDWGRYHLDMAMAQALSVKVSGLPSGLRASFEKYCSEEKTYECDIYLKGKTSAAPGDYPVTVTISNSRTGQVEHLSSVIRIFPAPSIQMMKKKFTLEADDYYDENGKPLEAHAEVTYTINGISGTAAYKVTMERPNGKQFTTSGSLPLNDIFVTATVPPTGYLEYSYYFYTATSIAEADIGITLNEDGVVDFSWAWFGYTEDYSFSWYPW